MDGLHDQRTIRSRWQSATLLCTWFQYPAVCGGGSGDFFDMLRQRPAGSATDLTLNSLHIPNRGQSP